MLIALGGCRLEREYTFTQTEDGLAMKAPITHTVRLRIDTVRNIVTWLQDSRDSKGVEDRSVTTYGDASFDTCEIFDQSNWSCAFVGANQQVLVRPVMKDGQLSRWYWTQEEKYRTKYRLFGLSF